MTAAQGHGPTIHTVVMDERTTDLFNLIDHEVHRRLADFRLGFVAVQEDAIRQAYLRGVRDGFQQGALAAEKRAESLSVATPCETEPARADWRAGGGECR